MMGRSMDEDVESIASKLGSCVSSRGTSLSLLGSWAKLHDVQVHKSLCFVPDGAAGISLRIHEDSPAVPAGSRLLTCPYTLSISYLNAHDTPLFPSRSPKFPKSFLESFPKHTVTVFFLAQQYLLGEDSFWWPYLSCLPQPDEPDLLGTPLHFSTEDLIWLRGTNLEKGYSDRKEEWQGLFDDALNHLKVNQVSVEAYTWEIILWAATILSSRCFTSKMLEDVVPKVSSSPGRTPSPDERYPVLFPVVDLINHQPKTEITWARDATGVALETPVELHPDQQIWNNYGAKGNEELLLGYGFCLVANPFDFVAVKFKPSYNATQSATRRKQRMACATAGGSSAALKSINAAQTHYICDPKEHVSKGYNQQSHIVFHPFPPALLDAVAILVANPHELRRLGCNPGRSWEASSAEPSIDHAASLRPRHRCHMLSQLASELMHQQERITIHDAELPKEPSNLRQKYAKIYRDSQLSILGAALQNISDYFRTASKTVSNSGRILTLEDAMLLDPSDENLREKVNTVLELLLGSHDIPELRQQGWEHEAWAIWLCYVTSDHSIGQGSNSLLGRWLDHIRGLPSLASPPKIAADGEDPLAEVLEIIASKRDSDGQEEALLAPVREDLFRYASAVVQQEGFWVDHRVKSISDGAPGQWVLCPDPTMVEGDDTPEEEQQETQRKRKAID